MAYVDVVTVFVGVLGSVAKKLGQWIGKLGIQTRTALLQRTRLLKTARGRCLISKYQESVPKGPAFICYDSLSVDI